MNLRSELARLQRNILLANHTTFRIGGPAKYFFEAKTKNEIIEAVHWAKENRLPFFIFGGGSNLLVSDKGFSGLVIKTQANGLRVMAENIEVEAGVLLSRLIVESINNNLTGLEWGIGIPGTIGGAVVGNTGAFRKSIADALENAEVFDIESSQTKNFNKEECRFIYRGSIFKEKPELIILKAVLKLEKGDAGKSTETIKEYLATRKDNVPSFPSAGSVFKNLEFKNQPVDFQKMINEEKIKGGMVAVGYLIDQCGLKGKRSGNAQISEQHANFIVNLGGAKAEDVLRLINLCRESVKEKFNISLEEEIRHLGFNDH